jgi:hypothetical protein
MIKHAFKFLALVLMCTMIACVTDNTPAPEPSSATLIYPEQNSACITGTVQSESASSITFNWTASAHTDSYEVHLKNLQSGEQSTFVVGANQLVTTLSRNTPYAWYVISKSAGSTATATSATWKFYNSGPAVVSHAPFPAEITSPTFAQEISTQNGKVALSWKGNDVDNDLVAYDVYFGSALTPGLVESNFNKDTLNVSVVSGTTYYWRVVSKDAKGNTSQSDRYHFNVK